eukprot:Unigene8966_Nuclearia_a/m.27450 Unigene8966_Nuclearia_a/g.27450  ORF Unigene8966_Nuclearia_a/g.27450 Unigene8966_Nuclearia_a/m.27450 type:complete len:176 (+) Unigene8966_Nuclearia_a:57-584(+)
MDTRLSAIDNIWIAASDDRRSDVVAMLDAGASVDARDDNGYSPLQAAASYGHAELLELLLKRGANPIIRDCDDDTPLHQAETVACAQLLLDHGADLLAKNSEGLTAEEVAGNDDRLEVQNFLRAKMGLPPAEPRPDAEEQLAELMAKYELGVVEVDEDGEWVDADDADPADAIEE